MQPRPRRRAAEVLVDDCVTRGRALSELKGAAAAEVEMLTAMLAHIEAATR